MRKYNTRVSLALLCIVSVHVITNKSSAQQLVEKPVNKVLDNTINHIREKHNVAAVAYVIVSGKKVIHQAVMGVSDKKTRKPASLDTIFRIGSITKSFTALALLKLQEQGRISLNDTLQQHAADAPINNPWQRSHPLTVAHLLEHTSGLADLTKKEFNYPKPLSLKQGLFFNPQGRTALWPPGLHSSYSNAGAGYAAYALEKITGKNFEDYVKQQIFKPLDMKLSNFYPDNKIQKRLATGYDFDGTTPIPYWHMIMRPFGAINTSTNEMSHFVQMLLNQGKYQGKTILSKESIKRMQSPKTTLAASTGLTFGYGLGSHQHIHNGFIFHGHSGDGDGYLARYAYNQQINRGYFVVINAFNHRAIKLIQRQIEDYITSGLKSPGKQKSIIVSSAKLQNYVGKYKAATYRFPWKKNNNNESARLEIILNNNSLQLKKTGDKPLKLIAVTDNHFKYEHEPVATMAFIEHKSNMYLQSEDGNFIKIINKD